MDCPPNPTANTAATVMPEQKKAERISSSNCHWSSCHWSRGGRHRRRGGWEPHGITQASGPSPMANVKPGDCKLALDWNPPTCPPPVGRMNKMLSVHATGYHNAMKMKDSSYRQPG